MRFSVSVPVLLQQICVAAPIVSHAFSCRTRSWSSIICKSLYAGALQKRDCINTNGRQARHATHTHARAHARISGVNDHTIIN